MGQQQLHRITDFAVMMAISPKTAWSWVAQRRIGVVRLGRAVRVPQSEIDRLLDDGFVPPLESK